MDGNTKARLRRLLNVSEAADYLGVSAASLRKWSEQGLVPTYRTPGGQRRYARTTSRSSSPRCASRRAAAVPRLGRNANSATQDDQAADA